MIRIDLEKLNKIEELIKQFKVEILELNKQRHSKLQKGDLETLKVLDLFDFNFKSLSLEVIGNLENLGLIEDIKTESI